MRKKRRPSYDAKFKQAAVSLMALSKTITGLAKKLGIPRKTLYRWRDHLQAGGKAALERGAGRPRWSQSKAVSPLTPSPAELRIAELERLLGRKQVELDLLKRAFKQVRGVAANRISDGAKGSIAASKPHSRSKAHPHNSAADRPIARHSTGPYR
jgi:transposase-like protein